MPASPHINRAKPDRFKTKKVHKQHIKSRHHLILLSNSQIRKSLTHAPPNRQNTRLDSNLSQLVQKERLECPVCLQMMVRPVLTNCGHHYCLHCLEHMVNCSRPCAICREELDSDSFRESPVLQQFVRQAKMTLKEEQLRVYQERKTKVERIESNRNVSTDVQIGDYLEFRRGGGWKIGKVTCKDQQGLVLTAKFKGNIEREYQFEYGSRDIANLGFFTPFKARPKISAQKEPILRMIDDDSIPPRPVQRWQLAALQLRPSVPIVDQEPQQSNWSDFGSVSAPRWWETEDITQVPHGIHEVWAHIAEE